MKIIIIGGTRFIGPSVVKKLYEQGHTIVLFHRGKSTANLPPDIAHIFGDRNSLADFRAEQDLTVDTSRIRNELGYKEIVSSHDAIKTTIEWELENPPANIDPEDYDYETEDEILERQ